jgi:cysteine desulfurase/selenocysteine lyase
MFNSKDIKRHFPIFAKHPDLVYLDSAATTLKPASVIAKEREYYEEYGANVARGLYPLSERATFEYEKTREMVAEFIHAPRTEEMIFTKGTTEAINLVASCVETQNLASLQSDAEILVPISEHHSNFLPWQALAARTGATFKTLPLTAEGQIDIETLDQYVTAHTKVFAFAYISNVLGNINPVREIIARVKAINPETLVLVDAAQAAAHLPIDVQDLGCDFLAFSSHKMFGPTGVGVLWGRYDVLEAMPPYQYGGEMVLDAGVEQSTFKLPPHKFEAGTPNIAGVIALQEAITFIQSLGWENMRQHEVEVLDYALEQLTVTFGDDITIIGSKHPQQKSGVISFVLDSDPLPFSPSKVRGRGIHPHDIAQLLGERSICIRAGQHCAHPLHAALATSAPKSFTSGQAIPKIHQLANSGYATARLSVSVYTTREDINQFVDEMRKIQTLFQ